MYESNVSRMSQTSCAIITPHTLYYLLWGEDLNLQWYFYLQGQNLVTLPIRLPHNIFTEEGVGFEPTNPLRFPVFKTGTINHSVTLPLIRPICQRTKTKNPRFVALGLIFLFYVS